MSTKLIIPIFVISLAFPASASDLAPEIDRDRSCAADLTNASEPFNPITPIRRPGPTIDFTYAGKTYRNVSTTEICLGDAKCVAVLDAPFIADIPLNHFLNFIKKGGFDESGGVLRFDIESGLINCHSYSCIFSEVPFVDKNMWIKATSPVDGSEQLKMILQTYFDKVGAFNNESYADPSPLAQIKIGDLVTFETNDRSIHHSGIVKEIAGDDLGAVEVRSKLGSGPVADAPVRWLSDHYVSPVIVIHRRKRRAGAQLRRSQINEFRPTSPNP